VSWPTLPVPWATAAVARGPRRWWAGPLDVEGLAIGSVSAAASAANALAATRDSSWNAFVPSGLVGASFGSISRLRVAGEPVKGWGEMSGFFRTSDGWIRLHGNYPHHAAVIRSVLGVSNRSGAESAIQEWEGVALEETLRAAGGIAGAVRTPDVWRAHPHHAAAIQDRPLVTLGASTGATRRLVPSTSLPLQGIRVLDLTRVIAGPTAARFLGALGADVLHIDRPDSPELLDQHLDTGFAKRTATVDFAGPDGQATAQELAGTADIVLTGYRPGALRRFGLDRESLLGRAPTPGRR
jgi:Predicted acyl-CoA transferases/carnitine dehydratase